MYREHTSIKYIHSTEWLQHFRPTQKKKEILSRLWHTALSSSTRKPQFLEPAGDSWFSSWGRDSTPRSPNAYSFRHFQGHTWPTGSGLLLKSVSGSALPVFLPSGAALSPPSVWHLCLSLALPWVFPWWVPYESTAHTSVSTLSLWKPTGYVSLSLVGLCSYPFSSSLITTATCAKARGIIAVTVMLRVLKILGQTPLMST